MYVQCVFDRSITEPTVLWPVSSLCPVSDLSVTLLCLVHSLTVEDFEPLFVPNLRFAALFALCINKEETSGISALQCVLQHNVKYINLYTLHL